MTFKAFKGSSFDHTHENKLFDQLYDLLKDEWSNQDETLYLLGNFFISGKEVDALIIKRNALIIIDLKNYGGVIQFSENGRWTSNKTTDIKGGNSANPFQQIRNNKFALLQYIKSNTVKLRSSPNPGHIAGLALFHQTIKFDEKQMPHSIRSWFHLTDLTHAIRTINSIVSPAIDLPQKDMDAFINAFNIAPYNPDGKVPTLYSKVATDDSLDNHPTLESHSIATKMEYYPYESFGNNSEKKLWEWFKEAFRDDDAVIYYCYPIFSQIGNLLREPDILMLHRQYGLWVFECKGCFIDNINRIQGHDWIMNDWYSDSIQPVFQVEDQMFAIKNKLDEQRDSRGKIHCNFRVALPEIKHSEWQDKQFDQLPSTGCVLVYEDLTPAALKQYIQSRAKQDQLSDNDWLLIKNILGGTLPNTKIRSIPTGTSSHNPVRVIQYIESQLKTLDKQQQKVSFEVPNGPQRLRGLAGTGKTIMFAKRMAKMHLKYPDWTIGFIFFTRALRQQITDLVTFYYQEMHPKHSAASPNWAKLKILHAWGGRSQTGFYHDLAIKSGLRPKALNDVIKEKGRLSPDKSFEYICQCLQKEATSIPVIYDALLIDEGQDLPPIFYQLAYATLSKERRIYWAYDEAQNIGSLMIPNAKKVFGTKDNGKSVVNIIGHYKGGIQKSHSISACYRTPEILLMAAHAINMGLFRSQGALQGVTNQDDWKKIGYEVTQGDFKAIGKPITVKRINSPHPTDQKDFPLQEALGSHLILKACANGREEHQWIAKQIANDIQLGLKPEDILITALSGDYEKDYFQAIKNSLNEQGISSYIAGVDGSPDTFRLEGCITIANIFRAKGNEAWKVYACRFHYAATPLQWKNENELHKRNEAFVALTRARLWCVVTGIQSSVFDELEKIIEQYPILTFPSFNQKSLKRVLDETETA